MEVSPGDSLHVLLHVLQRGVEIGRHVEDRPLERAWTRTRRAQPIVFILQVLDQDGAHVLRQRVPVVFAPFSCSHVDAPVRLARKRVGVSFLESAALITLLASVNPTDAGKSGSHCNPHGFQDNK
jgi:hypothetical protein